MKVSRWVKIELMWATLLAFVLVNIWCIPQIAGPSRVSKSGEVAGKMVLQTGRNRQCAHLGMVFDDGTQKDICVTIATYEAAKIGQRMTFEVVPKERSDPLRVFGTAFLVVGNAAIVLGFLLWLSNRWKKDQREQ